MENGATGMCDFSLHVSAPGGSRATRTEPGSGRRGPETGFEEITFYESARLARGLVAGAL